MEARGGLVRYAWLSIATAIGIIILKGIAYLLTGSVGFLSDALESGANIIAAIITLIALLIAARPPDQDHAYGHSKAEYLSSGAEGFLIMVAAVFIAVQAIIRFERNFPDMIGFMAATEQPFTESPLTAQYLAGEPLQKAALLSGSGRVRTLKVTSASVEAQATLDNPATVVFYTYDFPGWQATIDGVPAPHRTQPPYGLISLDVPAGDHTVAIRHGTTPVRTLGALISALSLVIALGLILTSFRRHPSPPPVKTH